MNLNKSVQLAILLALYLTRSGTSTGDTIAANLGISKAFLDQIARKMRKAGILTATKGPGGGYTLVPDTRLVQVIQSITPTAFLTKSEAEELRRGEPEHRALAKLSTNMSASIAPQLNRKVANIMQELVVNEISYFNGLNKQLEN